MSFPLFSRVVLTVDFPDENLVEGDVGTVVESHPAGNEYSEGYEVEFFAGNGETIAVISVHASALRPVTGNDVLHVRHLAPA